MNLNDLHKPFNPDRVSWRVGSTNGDKTKGLALAYIDARDVMERLDTVCGPANWACTYTHADKIVICSIGIKVDGEWVYKSNGAGETDVEGEKGATSDAFKRAAVLWGIGRYLYDVKSPWVEIEPMGRSYKIKDNQYSKLEALLKGTPTPPAPPAPKPPVDAQARAKSEAWAKSAIKALESFGGDSAEVDNWMTENKQGMEYLKAKHNDLFNEVLKTVGM